MVKSTVLSPYDRKNFTVLATSPTRRYMAKIFHYLQFLCNNCVKIVTIIKKFLQKFYKKITEKNFCKKFSAILRHDNFKIFSTTAPTKIIATTMETMAQPSQQLFSRNFDATLAFGPVVFLSSQKHSNFRRHFAHLSLIFAHTKTTHVSMRAFVTFMLRAHTTAHTSITRARYLCAHTCWRLLFVVVFVIVSTCPYWDYVSGFHVNHYVFA